MCPSGPAVRNPPNRNTMRNRHARVNVTRFALAMFPSPRHPRLPRTISPGPRAALQHEYGRNSKSARTTGEFNPSTGEFNPSTGEFNPST
eukprot:6173840-Pyramimonas_sp.AAC.2